MSVTAIFRAYSRSRDAFEAFAVANELQMARQPGAEQHYYRGVQCLRHLADALGYELVRKDMPTAPRRTITLEVEEVRS